MISRDATIVVSGGIGDENSRGSAWVFTQPNIIGVLKVRIDPAKPERPPVYYIQTLEPKNVDLGQCGTIPPTVWQQHLDQTLGVTGAFDPPGGNGLFCASGYYQLR